MSKQVVYWHRPTRYGGLSVRASSTSINSRLVRIIGAVSSGELAVETLTKTLRRRLPAYPLHLLRLARLGVDHRFQGHGIGRLLLRAMLGLALEVWVRRSKATITRIGPISTTIDPNADSAAMIDSL